jgi:hypothetical protein
MTKKFSVAAICLASLLTSLPASAQIARLGETFSVWADTSRGSAIAYDTRNNVYLVVSAHGNVNGRFVSADGAVLGQPFVFQKAAGFGQFPHVAYSPDANGGTGGFLVTWHESDAAVPSVHRRMVSYTHGFLTADEPIVGNDTYHEIMGAPVAYSTVSKEFLVLWRQYSDTNIYGMRLNLGGAPVSGAIPVAALPGLFESDHSIAYNPSLDEFLVVYRAGFGPTSVKAQRVKAGTGALVGQPSIVGQAATINTTGVTYNAVTGQYLVAWHQMPGDFVAGRTVAADGTPLGNATALSTRVGTYDSLSVDANEVSGTVLLVGHDKLSVEVGAAEINGSATPFTAGGPITAAGGNGNHVPKTISNPTRREWMISAARSFSQTIAQRVSTSTPGGGQPPPPPGPPPPPAPKAPTPIIALDVPASGPVSGQFAVAGWAVDLGATSGTGVDTVHVWAFSTVNGASTFVGPAGLGVARPDVGGIFGAQFSASGFGMLGSLPPGTYDINAYARSTVTGLFMAGQTKRITVHAPVSKPIMYVDMPAQGQTVTQFFSIVGWAADTAAAAGSGVSAIHVHAYPAAGGSPIFVGATSTGHSRPDVAAFLGNARFAPSAFAMTGNLPPGEYLLVVYAWSDVAKTFNNWSLVRIRVV